MIFLGEVGVYFFRGVGVALGGRIRGGGGGGV